MRLLSLDTSTGCTYISLMQLGELVLERAWPQVGVNRQETTVNIVSRIDEVIKLAGWQKSQLEGVVVGQGPGGFTTIRTAIVVARTIAQALRLPLIGISRLEVIGYSNSELTAVVLSGAKDHFFLAAYEKDEKGILQQKAEPRYANLDEAIAFLRNHEHLVGELNACSVLSTHGLSFQALPLVKNIASVQAEIAWNRLSLNSPVSDDLLNRLGEQFSWDKVEPLYLRAPSITITKSHGNQNKPHEISRPE